MTVELALERARVSYGPVEVLHGVDLAFPTGVITALLGRNGAGKTTTLGALAGVVPLAAGRVVWSGRDATRWPTDERSRRGLVLVPDQHGVFANLSVREHLELFAPGQPPDAALAAFPALVPLLDRVAGALSGGEQQMVALSHAFVRSEGVVLLDEISRGLAPQVVAQLYEAVAGLAAQRRTIVVVEQYVQEVLRLAQVAYVLRRGEVAFAGEASELDPATLARAMG